MAKSTSGKNRLKVVRPSKGMPTERCRRARGSLIIIGGHEDKKGDKLILREVARRVGSGKLVVATLASELAGELWMEYRRIFRGLGVRHIEHLGPIEREEVITRPQLKVLEGATAVFFTGGHQLRITTRLGGSLLSEIIQEIYERGGLIAGTSAGASVIGESMPVYGDGMPRHGIRGMSMLAPGLGLLKDVIIDQHFAERGRLGRLLGALAQNPRLLGLGIDEDTAVIVEQERMFSVIGSGAVHVADGFEITYTNIAEDDPDRALSVFDVRLHLMSQGDKFDLQTRRPSPHPVEPAEEKPQEEAARRKEKRTA
jgi:cyanophycinase